MESNFDRRYHFRFVYLTENGMSCHDNVSFGSEYMTMIASRFDSYLEYAEGI